MHIFAVPFPPAFIEQDHSAPSPPHKMGGKPDNQREELAGLGGTQPNLRLLFIQSLNAEALE